MTYREALGLKPRKSEEDLLAGIAASAISAICAAIPEFQADLLRLFLKVERVDDRGCWIWAHGKNRQHPKFWPSGDGTAPLNAHRFVLIALGHDMEWLVGRHSCDNNRCVNPAHLLPGTQLANIHDAITRGRKPPLSPMNWPEIMKSQRHHWQKLKREDIPLIRQRLANGETQVSIAKDFGVTDNAISEIKRGKTWQHVA